MTILICGVVYWFWTQNQYVLRKLHLLNNIVFEIRTQLNKQEENQISPENLTVPTEYAPAPGSVIDESDEDLQHERLIAEVELSETSTENVKDVPVVDHVTPFEVVEDVKTTSQSDDLEPGGSLLSREVKSESGNMLDSLTLKELRRLGEQRGISGAASMKKAQLLTAIRELPNETFDVK